MPQTERPPQPTAAEDQPQQATPRHFWLELLDWVKYILVAVIVGLVITTFVLQRNEVIGNSMYPTLHSGDQLWVEKLSPRFRAPRRGEIVTFSTARLGSGTRREDLVKRVVGLPGEHLEIRDGRVYIDGQPLDEPYLAPDLVTEARVAAFADIVLAEDEYYVLGDNRPDSSDSRVFGPVAKRDIIGEVLIRIYPFNRIGRP